jgi:hypothetical protein
MQTLAAIQKHLIVPDVAQLASRYLCSPNAMVIEAVTSGHYERVEEYIGRGGTCGNALMRVACRSGYIEIVRLMLSAEASLKHGDWNACLYGACRSGDVGLVDLVIKQGANNWDRGMRGACAGGHPEAAVLMIIRGATRWDDGLYHACNGEHPRLIKLMITHGAKPTYRDARLAGYANVRGLLDDIERV